MSLIITSLALYQSVARSEGRVWCVHVKQLNSPLCYPTARKERHRLIDWLLACLLACLRMLSPHSLTHARVIHCLYVSMGVYETARRRRIRPRRGSCLPTDPTDCRTTMVVLSINANDLFAVLGGAVIHQLHKY